MKFGAINNPMKRVCRYAWTSGARHKINIERHAHRRSGGVGDQQTHGTAPDKHKSLEKRLECCCNQLDLGRASTPFNGAAAYAVGTPRLNLP
jgi:hypothetical protein